MGGSPHASAERDGMMAKYASPSLCDASPQ